jgi:Family of unknown function (DUF6274)
MPRWTVGCRAARSRMAASFETPRRLPARPAGPPELTGVLVHPGAGTPAGPRARHPGGLPRLRRARRPRRPRRDSRRKGFHPTPRIPPPQGDRKAGSVRGSGGSRLDGHTHRRYPNSWGREVRRMATSVRHETGALLRAHLAAATRYRHVTRHCAVCHRLLRLALEHQPDARPDGPIAVQTETQADPRPDPQADSQTDLHSAAPRRGAEQRHEQAINEWLLPHPSRSWQVVCGVIGVTE